MAGEKDISGTRCASLWAGGILVSEVVHHE